MGALSLNQVVPAAIAELPQLDRIEIRHQAGQETLRVAQAAYAAANLDVEPVAFIEDMSEAYRWADLVVCRAGAMTVAELAAVGVASILVPYPHAVADEQSMNARYLQDTGAALVVPEADLSPGYLCRLLHEFHSARDRLLTMAQAGRALAMPEATARVAGLCLETANA